MERRRLSSQREPTVDALREAERALRETPDLTPEQLAELDRRPQPSFADFIQNDGKQE